MNMVTAFLSSNVDGYMEKGQAVSLVEMSYSLDYSSCVIGKGHFSGTNGAVKVGKSGVVGENRQLDADGGQEI